MRGLTDSGIEKILLTTASFSLLTLALQAIGWNQGPVGLILTLIFCFLLSGFGKIHQQLKNSQFTESWFSQISFWIFLFLGLYQILFYFTESTGSHFIHNPNLNGDWPMHLNQILFLTKNTEFWPANPILGGEPMRYAFGINWLSAQFFKMGFSLNLIILVTGAVSLWLVATLLHRSFGAWGLWAFFASGGGWGSGVEMLTQAWGPGSQLAWKNLLLAVYLPQRGFWFALPCGLYLLRFLFKFWQENSGEKTLHFPMSFVFLWACLPFFHLHTFVAVSLFILITVIHQRAWASVFKFIPFIWLPLIFVGKSLDSENTQSSVRWSMGWMNGSLDFINSWVINAGPWLFVCFILFLYAISKPGRRGLMALLVGLGFIFNFLLLAPWPWDQIKIILWIYLAFSFFMAEQVEKQTSKVVGILLIILVHATGFIQLAGGIPSARQGSVLWGLADQSAVRQLLQKIPVQERILMAPDPHHPIWSSGRAVVAGYEGHIWAHGVNTEGLKESIFAVFNGQEIQTLRFSKLSSNHLLWGPLEKTWFGVQAPPEAQWLKSDSIGEYSLYLRVPSIPPLPN